jgi:hypothetical protein
VTDLIERLNEAWRKLYGDGDEHGVCDTLAEAAAALEAAREDAERYRWLRSLNGACDAAACVTFNIGFDWIEQHGAELDAAIDQARGKGGQEVGK